MTTPPPDVIAAAQAAQRAFGILTSIQLAQWAQESGWGKVVTGAFNYFGVKAAAGQPNTMCATHEVVDGVREAVQAPFRNYDSVADAFEQHAQLLASGTYFAAAYPLRNDYRAYAEAIGPHYATDPNYAAELINLIEDEGFTRYDLLPASPFDPIAASQTAVDGAA